MIIKSVHVIKKHFLQKFQNVLLLLPEGGGNCLFGNKTADSFQYVQEAVQGKG
jgi:hypothetical protein